MENLVVFLELVTLTCAFTTLPPTGFPQTDNSMFWGHNGMDSLTPSPFFPEYSIHNAQQQALPNQQPSIEELVRLLQQNNINIAKQNTTNAHTVKADSNTQSALSLPWLTGINTGTNNQVADLTAQANMLQLQRIMLDQSHTNINGLPQGNIGPQQGLASLYQAYIQQMNMQTTTTTTTTTPAPTPSPTISSYTPPPFKYGPSEGKTPSPTKTLAEIILDRMNQLEHKNSSNPSKTKGCYYKNRWYSPLKEISKGQTGDWCYGTYCNHEGVVVHWDDHKCTQTVRTTPPPFTQSVPTTTPATNAALGCFQNGRWYDPGQDISNNRNPNTGMCFGSYCDYKSKIVKWEDNCYATVAPDSAMSGMAGMPGMGGGMEGGMAGMAGMAGMGGGMAGMAGMGGGMAGMGGGMEGGMAGMTGMGGGMAGMGGGMTGMGGGMGGMGGSMEGMSGMAALAAMEGMGGTGMGGMGGMGAMGGMGGMGAMGGM